MKKLLMIAFVAILALACDKNQKAVRILDGKWEATSFILEEEGISFDAVAFGFINFEIVFENCKLKNEETCAVTLTTSGILAEDIEVENAMYKVTNDGETLEVITGVGPDMDIQIFNIEELTKEDLEMTFNDDEDFITVKMKKV